LNPFEQAEARHTLSEFAAVLKRARSSQAHDTKIVCRCVLKVAEVVMVLFRCADMFCFKDAKSAAVIVTVCV